MTKSLSNLGEWIDPVIIDRGRDYYLDGRVVDLKSTSEGVHYAQVEGSESYEVAVLVSDSGVVEKLGCDCPYDFGPVCKHEAAVLLAIRKQSSDVATDEKVSPMKTEPTLEQLIQNESKENLIKLMLKLASYDEDVSQQIKFHLTKSDGKEDLKRYQKLIRQYIRENADRGFVRWSHVSEAITGAELVLEKAIEAFENEEWGQAVKINLCVISEMVDLLQMADDSSGYIGGIITISFENISDVLSQASRFSEAEKATIFQLLLNEPKKARYKEWPDWQLALVNLTSEVVTDTEMFERWERHVDELFSESEEQASWSSNYEREKLANYRYHLLLRLEGERAAWDYLMDHLQFTHFRILAIEKAFENKDYDAAIQLAEEGEKKDESHLGLVRKWQHYRFKAYTLTSQLEKQRELGRELILSGDFSYYKLIKETYEAKEWAAVYTKLLEQLEEKRWPGEVYFDIILEEKDLDRLLEAVKKAPYHIERFYSELVGNYPDDVNQLFVVHIEYQAVEAKNRRDYKGVCSIIKKYKKVVGSNAALDLIEKLALKYPKRPAFQDELRKIK